MSGADQDLIESLLTERNTLFQERDNLVRELAQVNEQLEEHEETLYQADTTVFLMLMQLGGEIRISKRSYEKLYDMMRRFRVSIEVNEEAEECVVSLVPEAKELEQ
jgi:hypothetical protein